MHAKASSSYCSYYLAWPFHTFDTPHTCSVNPVFWLPMFEKEGMRCSRIKNNISAIQKQKDNTIFKFFMAIYKSFHIFDKYHTWSVHLQQKFSHPPHCYYFELRWQLRKIWRFLKMAINGLNSNFDMKLDISNSYLN